MGERTRRKRFECVVVPTDFSPGSVAALDRALALPLAAGARVEVVHVLPEVAAKLRANVEAAALDALDAEVARARALAPAHHVTGKLLRGERFVEVIRYARDADADLIVLGRHGRRPLHDFFLGTTADRVVRMGDTPTLVVHGPGTKPYRRPLVAIDLGDTSRQLVELMLRCFEDRAAVTAVHAFHVPYEGLLAATAAARARLRKPMAQAASTKLARLLAPYEAHARWRLRVRTGDPRAAVVDEAILRGADLIVVGTHGRSGLSHAMIGSVAEWVIANAPCDVLVARPSRFTFERP